MFLESFRHIIEIASLQSQNKENLKQISSENKRISDLVERRNKTIIYLENLKKEDHQLKLNESQRIVDDLIARQKKLQSQFNLAVTEKEQKAFENQIHLLAADIEKTEASYFEKLERSEAIAKESVELNEFLQGSEETLQTLTKEVQVEVQNNEKIIENRNLRISSLKELLHPSVLALFIQCENNTKVVPSVSFMIDRKCSECHMAIDFALKSSLEQGISVETCPHCGRLLIPDTAKIH